MIRFLFDENMSLRLPIEAHLRDYEAYPVSHLGLCGFSDRALLPQIVGGDFTFVTNNRRDFLRLYKYVEVHAGLLVVLPSVRQADQVTLFLTALDAIEATGNDPTNELIEVDADGVVRFSRYPFAVEN